MDWCGERPYIVTAAEESALSGKAKAQAVMANSPSWKKFKGHTQSAKTKATDRDASAGHTHGTEGRENAMVPRLSLTFPNCRGDKYDVIQPLAQ